MIGLVALILAVSATYLFRQIYDPDFFWHLKTGEWIWQHGILPTSDPFTHTATEPATPRQLYLLTSYWLCQILYYVPSITLGWWWIFILRVLLVISLVMAVAKRKGEDGVISICTMAICFMCLLEVYPLERPQVVSFVFLAVLVRLIDGETRNTRDAVSLMAITVVGLLMLFWSNIHGGVIIGQAFLAACLLRELVVLLLTRATGNNSNKTILFASVTGLLSSLLNPNLLRGVEIVSGAMKQSSSHYYASGTEYMSSLAVLKTGDYTVILAWVVTALFLVSLLFQIRKLHAAFVALALAIVYYSIVQVRYIPFLLVIAIPVIVRFFSELRAIAVARAGFVLLAVGAVWYFAGNELSNFQNIRRSGWIDEAYYPVRAAEFVRNGDITGNMFNSYLWGGYLIWRLGPDRKVFVDGRGMDQNVFWDLAALETSASWGSTEKPLWKTMFEKYGITYAILPKRQESGAPYLLSAAIARDPGWKVVFQSYNSMVLLQK